MRAQNKSETYRYTNKASAKAMARTLAIESTQASVYDDERGTLADRTYVLDLSGRVVPVVP